MRAEHGSLKRGLAEVVAVSIHDGEMKAHLGSCN